MKLSEKWDKDKHGNYTMNLGGGRLAFISNGDEPGEPWWWAIVPQDCGRRDSVLSDPTFYRSSYKARLGLERLIRALQGVTL